MSVGFYSSALESKGFAGFRRLLWLMSGVHMGCRAHGFGELAYQVQCMGFRRFLGRR